MISTRDSLVQIMTGPRCWTDIGGITSALWRFDRFLIIRGHYKPNDAGQSVLDRIVEPFSVRFLPAGYGVDHPYLVVEVGIPDDKRFTIDAKVGDIVRFRCILRGKHLKGSLD